MCLRHFCAMPGGCRTPGLRLIPCPPPRNGCCVEKYPLTLTTQQQTKQFTFHTAFSGRTARRTGEIQLLSVGMRQGFWGVGRQSSKEKSLRSLVNQTNRPPDFFSRGGIPLNPLTLQHVAIFVRHFVIRDLDIELTLKSFQLSPLPLMIEPSSGEGRKHDVFVRIKKRSLEERERTVIYSGGAFTFLP